MAAEPIRSDDGDRLRRVTGLGAWVLGGLLVAWASFRFSGGGGRVTAVMAVGVGLIPRTRRELVDLCRIIAD